MILHRIVLRRRIANLPPSGVYDLRAMATARPDSDGASEALIRIEVGPGEELMASLRDRLRERGLTSAAIVSLIGAVDACEYSTMPADDARADLVHQLDEPLELSGTGEVVDGTPHVHCVLARADGTARAGHLRRAWVETWFVRVYLAPATEP
jgi:uncharacterized protein